MIPARDDDETGLLQKLVRHLAVICLSSPLHVCPR
jgi:hypothetical protein